MGYPPLPHELDQWHKIEDFEHLKIAHKLYSLGVVVEYHKQEGMVDSSGRNWFQGMGVQAEFRLVQSFGQQGFERAEKDDNLDASSTKHKH